MHDLGTALVDVGPGLAGHVDERGVEVHPFGDRAVGAVRRQGEGHLPTRG